MDKFNGLAHIITITIFALAMGLFNCSTAEAVLLDDSGWDISYNSYLDGLVQPVIDTVGDDNVVIELFKTYNGPIEDNASESLVIEFTKVTPEAKQNIIITDEYIMNLTGHTWHDFHMAIINPLYPKAGFDPQYVPSGDQLEDVSYSGTSGYEELPMQINFVDSDGLGVPSDGVFWPGWEQGKIVIVTNPGMQVGESFLVKEWATTPEPAAVVLLGFSSISLLIKRRR